MRNHENRALARTLSSFSAFAACRQSDLEALTAAARVTSLPAGWTFVHEGTPADAVYVLLDGNVRVVKDGRELASLGPGSVLGEMGLLGRSLRRASVVTVTAVKALRFEYDALSALLRTHPHLQQSVAAVYDQHRAAEERGAPQAAREVSGG